MSRLQFMLGKQRGTEMIYTLGKDHGGPQGGQFWGSPLVDFIDVINCTLGVKASDT